MKKIRNKIDGILLLDKPLGISSNNAIQKIKYLLNAEKVGHTGTLDPMATGLLPVCLGEATKFANFLLDGDKEYIATAQLGIVTDSGDSEGNIVSKNEVITNQIAIEDAISKFRGEIVQIPPMYSALKYNGRPLYEYAREGITVERAARKVIIYKLELLNYDQDLQQITFIARVSKGTYIRTLGEDIGNKLGCGASLISLKRTKTNDFSIDSAYTLEDIQQVSSWQSLTILPIDKLCDSLPIYNINNVMFERVKNGNPCIIDDDVFIDKDVRIYYHDKFLGIAQIIAKNDQIILAPKRMLSNLYF